MVDAFYILRHDASDGRIRAVSLYDTGHSAGRRTFLGVTSIDEYVDDRFLQRIGDMMILQGERCTAVEVLALEHLPENANAYHVGGHMNILGTEDVAISIQYYHLADSRLETGLSAEHGLLATNGMR